MNSFMVGMTTAEVLDRVVDGYTMSKPDVMPEETWKVVKSCWRFAPEHRPTFDWLSSFFNDCFHAQNPRYENLPGNAENWFGKIMQI